MELFLEKGRGVAEQLDPKDLVSFKELLMTNSIQVDAAVQLLIKKGSFTEREYFSKLKQVQGQYAQGQRYA
jgi:hypothetical protein